MPQYSITLVRRVGFREDSIETVSAWFNKHSEECLLVKEPHKDGRLHLHAACTLSLKSTNQVTRKLETLFKNNKWDLGPRDIRVKRTVNEVGWFHYLCKANDSCDYVLLKGWTDTWIQQQMRESVKSIPRRIISKDYFVVSKHECVARILHYCDAHNIKLIRKTDFIQVIGLMRKSKYLFHGVRWSSVYPEVMAILGVSAPSIREVEMGLLIFDE